jgi:asparagine synthase (glutamine-hydrolysing)
MCGLSGVYTSGSPAADLHERVGAMNAALAHRGPDDHGIWRDENIALGHRRLSIIDLSSAGHQPMHSADGRYVLVFNGEIYNFRTLRAELADYPYRSHTDSEVLLAAYAHWGADCLSRLQGMFAFAIWDREARSLFVARDRLGIKPLYYYQDESFLAFASEIRAVLRCGLFQPRLNQAALVDYLRYQTVHSPETILEGVRMLRPGHYLMASPGQGVQTKMYWSLLHPPPLAPRGREEWRTAILNAFRTAVEKRLVADVPFGAFLSGGIDSSAVVALMAESGCKVNTFNITFSEEAYNEASYARLVARKFNTDHHEIHLSPREFLALIPEALSAMDHPSGDGPNTYVVSKATKAAGITMALSGLGGDELFAGYAIFKRAAYLERWRLLNVVPKAVLRSIGYLVGHAFHSIAAQKVSDVLAEPYVSALSAYPHNRQVFSDRTLVELLSIPLAENVVKQLLRSWGGDDGFAHLPMLSQISVAEMSTYMQDVLLRDTDQMSMAHALEVRVPFLDHELVELVLQIPDSIKYPHSAKQLLVESLGDRLPPEIVRRRKMGFNLPYREWMKGELREFCAARLQALGARPCFRAATIARLWQDLLADRPGVSWSRLWVLVVLEAWLQQNGVA